MATYNKDDLDITVLLLAGHLEVLQKQVQAKDWQSVNGTLYRMQGECTNSIQMTRQMLIDEHNKLRLQSQQTIDVKAITQSGDY